ncbi:hypothetical protein K504DRAFT_500243 [Pleomassaria siparia CBS 279.74]|uniref:Arylsulfotransferase n=1 Tax=Pleomassaria siparia CBS 279.74 TaxID=1314801 RepID=A0A6G1KG22_9PLEO|nr:hypothetical protein K504DRAFT_500243 [Pleomassaria siparia CBS 279.74]
MLSNLFLLPNSILLCVLLQNVGHVRCDSPPYTDDPKFETGEYGAYPMQRFHSSKVVAPRPNLLSTHPSCDDGSLTMLNPRGNAVPEEARGPVILDSQGNAVWSVTGYDQTYNLQAQEYRGKQYLTFWSGNDAIGGHGNGQYIMLDSSYKEVARIKAANGLEADLHEFRLTDAGTALITVYDVQHADLTKLGGKSDGYIWDSVFQEIDIETGKLVFQWRASDHFDVTDSYRQRGNQGGRRGDPWDFFHINSVDKDPSGNYLISARYTSTVTYINGKTGKIIWVLGGRKNNFADLSDGRATDFRYQHDARWHNNYTTISIFNNGAQAPNNAENAQFSRAMKIDIDTSNSTAMTTKLDTQYINTLQISSSSQGNMQILPNGNTLVGYGYNAAFTEFASNGVALCETHFGATSRFHTGDVQSYRVMKFNWTGIPNTDPDIALVDGSLYVSWNGATEVRKWVLETGNKRVSRNDEEIKWLVASKTKKNGFETEIKIPNSGREFVRIVGVDGSGKSLGSTRVVQLRKSSPSTGISVDYAWEEAASSTALRFLGFCVAMLCFGITFSWVVDLIRQWRSIGRYEHYSKVPMEDV